MIPRKIFTMWFGDNPSELVKRCIKSQQIEGYEHQIITLDNAYKDYRYVREAIETTKLGTGKWCKVSDFLRQHYLFTEGGIYLDADVEILPGKNFDALLDNQIFVGYEQNGTISSCVMGAEPHHPLQGIILSQVEDNFRGDGGWIWEPGMKYFIDTLNMINRPNMGIKILPAEYFFPYDWQKKTTNITPNTITNHHFMGSWVNG